MWGELPSVTHPSIQGGGLRPPKQSGALCGFLPLLESFLDERWVGRSINAGAFRNADSLLSRKPCKYLACARHMPGICQAYPWHKPCIALANLMHMLGICKAYAQTHPAKIARKKASPAGHQMRNPHMDHYHARLADSCSYFLATFWCPAFLKFCYGVTGFGSPCVLQDCTGTTK